MNFNLVDGGEVALPTDGKCAAQFLADTIVNNGYVPSGDGQVKWADMYQAIRAAASGKDAVAAPDIAPLLRRSTEIIMREPVEPLKVIKDLFTPVRTPGMQTQVLGGALGAVYAQDIPENGTYPEVMFQVGGAMQTAWVSKTGIAAAFTDEALRYSTWDIMSINFRLMRDAMARLKEQKAVSFLRRLGTTLFDNAAPANSLFGVCTGRGLNMSANGSPTMQDIFKGVAHMGEEGFPPDTLLMNPLFFYLGIQDPVLQNLYMLGMGGAYFQQWGGQSGPRDPWSNGSMGAQGPSTGNKIVPGGQSGATGVAGREHGMTAAPPFPSPYLPWNLRIVVSPLVPYDPVSETGDMYLLSSGNVGFHLIDEDLVRADWREEATEVVKFKLRERYGFAVAHEGQGVGVFRNVKLARNYWDGVVRTQHSGPTVEIDRDTDLDL